MANQFSSDLKSLTTKAITAGMKTLPRLSFIAVVLFLCVGAAQSQCSPGCTPCVLLSEISPNGQVYVYPDSGGNASQRCDNGAGYLKGYTGTGGGGGGGEGLSCLSGSTNALYTVNRTNVINTFQLSTGNWIQPSFSHNSTDVIGSVVATAGKILYAGQGTSPQGIYSLNASSTGVALGSLTTPVPTGDEVALGACPPNNPECGYAGNVFTDASANPNTNSGINVYVAQPSANITLTPASPQQFLPGIPVVGNSNCANFMINGAPVQHCWNNLTGMAFDGSGNLWVNNVDTTTGQPGLNNTGTFEFAPPTPGSGYGCNAPVCPVNFTPYGTPQERTGTNPEPIGVTIAPANDPDNPGYVMVAFVQGQDVFKINPVSCTGAIGSPGTCTSNTLFMNDSGGFPKRVDYPQVCPNPDNNGYLEICKQSNPDFPVTGTFDFTATVPFFSSGTIAVPVGECSGPVEVPSGQVTVTETPTIGDLVSDVTACSYNPFGQCVPDLISWTLPDLYAIVPVATGGVSSETLATFTNYAASPGQLKVCKIAGLGTPVGTEFTFTVTGLPPFQVEAGPADQGGFCELVGTFPVNTPVTVAETPNPMYPLTNVTDECNACTYSINLPQSSMTTTIGAGITVVGFTNTMSSVVPPGSCIPSASESVLLVNGTNVLAYVPEGNWGGGGRNNIPNIKVTNIEGNAVTPFDINTGTDVINSCASDPTLSETVCTANNNAVYTITGNLSSPTVTRLTSGGSGTILFSGGSCTNCGVAMDAVHHQAVLGLSLSSRPGYQFLDIPSGSFEPPIVSPARQISEDIMVDPISTPPLLLSAAEGLPPLRPNYEIATIANTLNPMFFENPIYSQSGFTGGNPDSSGEDCSTGIALSALEYTNPSIVYIADLDQATFSSGMWTAASQFQTLTESNLGDDASQVSVASGTHIGVVSEEYGGSATTAILLPSTSGPGTGTPAVQDWVTCNIPDGFMNGYDPHTVTTYQTPGGVGGGGIFPAGDAIAVLVNNTATMLAVVDLSKMLNPIDVPRTSGGHGCSAGSLPASGPTQTVFFIALPPGRNPSE